MSDATQTVAPQPSDDIAIDLIDVHKWYGEFHVLKGINLSVAGASGSSSAAPPAPANPR